MEHWLLGLQSVFFFLQDHIVMRISYVLVSRMSRAAYCSGLRLFEEHEGERYCAQRWRNLEERLPRDEAQVSEVSARGEQP